MLDDVNPDGRVRVRWKIFGLVFCLGVISYVQQRGISVASYQMMPQLGLSQMQIGWLQSAFLLGYTALQFPGGALGQRLGARSMYVLTGLIAFAATVGTPLAPLLLNSAGLFLALLFFQLLLGVAQGPFFPVSAGVLERWFRPHQWPLLQGLQSMGLGFGSALTPPLIAWLMASFGWQRALLWTALPALIIVGLWAWYGRNSPAEHPAVSRIELDELGEHASARIDATVTSRRLWAVLKNREVLALTASYLCMNYVYYLLSNWCFLYLVQERHFTLLESGWLAGTPPLAAAIGAGIGGKLSSELGRRCGPRWGLHFVPLFSLPAAALLLLIAVHAGNAYFAVAALALSFCSIELTEGSYWAATMHVAREDTMSATGVLNTGGNVGGLVATPIVAYLSGQHEWKMAFVLGTVFAIAAAAAWLLVNPTRYINTNER